LILIVFAKVSFNTIPPAVDPTNEIVVAVPAIDAAGPVRTNPVAFAEGADTTENNPAVSADTATTAMRFLIVLLDIFFLSLVELGNFPISARRSC
jgi:hypothetical protein